ncbi:PadR family transcriptional regulator [Corynebacterium sp. A21]|uniref:PadR family transcriptional regulator n=1 Tax=Corynebacterium sp. A21 TaxID=3457318 RepID=UPI003FD674DB
MSYSHENHARGFDHLDGSGRGGPCGHGRGPRRGHSYSHGHRNRGEGGGYGGFRHGRGRGGRAGRGDLRNVILFLLSEEPMHGYQLISLIGEKTNSQWTPSPGAIYPTLNLLEDEGLITITTDSGRKLATLTEVGATLVEENKAEWSQILSGYANPQNPQDPRFRHREAMFRLRNAVKATRMADHEQAIEILNRAAKEIEEL